MARTTRRACSGNHVPCFELVRSDGTHRLCSPTENPDWYAATIGGMGLTGLGHLGTTPAAANRCTRMDCEHIQFLTSIDEFLSLKQKYQHVEYTAQLVDYASTGKNSHAALYGGRTLEGARRVEAVARTEAGLPV